MLDGKKMQILNPGFQLFFKGPVEPEVFVLNTPCKIEIELDPDGSFSITFIEMRPNENYPPLPPLHP